MFRFGNAGGHYTDLSLKWIVVVVVMGGGGRGGGREEGEYNRILPGKKIRLNLKL